MYAAYFRGEERRGLIRSSLFPLITYTQSNFILFGRTLFVYVRFFIDSKNVRNSHIRTKMADQSRAEFEISNSDSLFHNSSLSFSRFFSLKKKIYIQNK